MQYVTRRIRIYALTRLFGLLLAVSPAAVLARCPVDPHAAAALFAKRLPSAKRALKLVRCDQPIARVLAIRALSDQSKTPPVVLDAIVAALSDQAEIVREAALVAVLRNAEAIRPMLRTKMGGDAFGADDAAAALAVIGAGAADISLPGSARWGALFREKSALRDSLPDYGQHSRFSASLYTEKTGEPSLYADTNFARWSAIPRCLQPTVAAFISEPTQCRFVGKGETAYAKAVISGLDLVSIYNDFAAKRVAARAASAIWRSVTQTLLAQPSPTPASQEKSSDQIICELTGACGADSAMTEDDRPEVRNFSIARRSADLPVLADLPHFPWPAPRPVLQQPIPLSALGGPGMTLGDVADALRNRIQAADPDFEIGVFSGPPDGFVLLTRMERITDDGAPFPAPNRFTVKGNPSAGFWDAIRGLMAERPGHFRVIAFVVTSQIAIDPTRSPLSIPIDRIGEASVLPVAVARVPMGARRIFALVYAFERRPGKPQQPWTDGAPSALMHLRRSGIGRRIGL